MINLEQNPKLGYYKVNGHIFHSKPQAYIYATEVKQDPTWFYNNAEFGKFNWLVEPELDIRELYRLRAQQLRDRYDYIKLELSGGSDSVTVAYAFLLNGIHLDEVMYRYPAQLDKNVTNDPYNTKPENTLSERQFAAEPILNWIKTNCPNTKVTIQDYSENLLNTDYMRDESWLFTTRDWFQPGNGIKHNNFNTKEQRELADTGKRICVLYGIDKPKVTLIDNNWYIYFTDVRAGEPNPVMLDYTNLTSECFFWSPDLPEVLSKQGHMVKRWFEMSQNHHLHHLVQYTNTVSSQRTAYENIVKAIIYPDYDQTTWQTSKPSNSFYNEMDHWFHTNLKDTHYDQVWRAGLKFLLDKIDSKYFVRQLGIPVGLVNNNSPLYHLGEFSTMPVTAPKFSNSAYLPKQNVVIVQNKKLNKTTV